VAVGFSLSLALAPAHADDWAGLYVGIDSLDGSLDYVSIAPQGDGTYSFRVSATKFGFCEAAHPEAVLTGVGRISDDALVIGDATIWCSGSQGEPLQIFDLPLAIDRNSGELSFPAASDGRRLNFTRISVGPNASDDWVGFYAAIDGADGSIDQTAISRNDDGTYGITVKSTRFDLCPSAHPAAFQTATGVIEDGNVGRSRQPLRRSIRSELRLDLRGSSLHSLFCKLLASCLLSSERRFQDHLPLVEHNIP